MTCGIYDTRVKIFRISKLNDEEKNKPLSIMMLKTIQKFETAFLSLKNNVEKCQMLRFSDHCV